MNKCVNCNKILKKIGTKKPLKNHDGKDWETRKLHKKCWIEYEQDKDSIISNMNITDKQRLIALKELKKRYGLK